MKTTYESFQELANAMTAGEGVLHGNNCTETYSGAVRDAAYNDPCMAWQKGVHDFAGWLDHIGATVNITDSAENFYDYMRKTEQ